MGFRVAIDVGGTFTDLVGYEEGSHSVVVAKESTTPADFSVGVLRALEKSQIPPKKLDRFFANGSTIVINALTERKGARTALLTTRGFRDVLQIQRSNRPDIYNFNYVKPKPFIPRRLIFEVRERLGPQGEVIEPLDLSELPAHLQRCRAEGIEAIAVCFFNSYANGEHERRCAHLVREHLPAVYVCCSHDLTQEYREYERTNTSVLNAYVQPPVGRYLDNLERGLRARGVTAALYSMASNGGVMSFSQARNAPIQLAESGPVAGAIGAKAIGEAVGYSNLITIDVGGTTAKTTLIHDGRIRINTDYFIERSTSYAGYPLKVPSLDIVEIGAGGGSIFWRDQGGSLRVGPRSAGAVPGPASYGRGGDDPTLTDAFLLAGVLNPAYFLGGEVALEWRLARKAYEKMGRAIGLPAQQLPQGAVRLANALMINALKLVSVKRGYDPRDFAMVAFGGGGPLHAASIARPLGIREVIIPQLPGVFSAWGMLLADLRRDFLRTQLISADESGLTRLLHIFQELESVASKTFAAEGYGRSLQLFRFVDARYRGQEHTVKVPMARTKLNHSALLRLRRAFDELHQASFQFRLSDPLEIVNCHLVAQVTLPKPSLQRLERRNGRRVPPKSKRTLFLDGKRLTVPVYERSALGAGIRLYGPVIIEEPTSTTVVNPGDRLVIDSYGNLRISVGG